MSDRSFPLALALSCAAPLCASAQDWPMWGRDETRNMNSSVTGLPSDFSPGKFKGTSDEIDATTTRNVRWIAKLGSQSYGNVTVAGGRVYVGTNNDVPRDPKYTAPMAQTTCIPVTASITAPSSTMRGRLPCATPSSMIAALTVGRYSDASVLTSWRAATIASSERYGRVYRRSSVHSIPLLSHTVRRGVVFGRAT